MATAQSIPSLPVQPPFSTPIPPGQTPASILWTVPITIDSVNKTISIGVLPPVNPGDYIKWTTPGHQDPFVVVFGNPFSPTPSIVPGVSVDGGISDSETPPYVVLAPLVPPPSKRVSYSYTMIYMDIISSSSYMFMGDDPVVIVDSSGG
jgi:hypothetical protein